MISHFGLMLLFGLFVSLVFALLMRENPQEQLVFGATLFSGIVGVGVFLGWLFYALPL